MSFVDTILQSAPRGSNPYAFAAEFVATIVPRKPEWYFANLIAVGVIAAINLASTVASFVVLRKRSRRSSAASFWFFKAQHGHPSGVPYLMPNALTMFLLWNSVFMTLMQPYIWLNYVAYYSPSLQITSRMYFWYGFIFIWDGVGMWLSAFGTLYATLMPRIFLLNPSKRRIACILLHPMTLNAFCLVPPIVLVATQIITSIFSAIAWSDLVHTQFGLIKLLSTLASQWAASTHQNVNVDLARQAVGMGSLFLQQKDTSLKTFQRNVGTCAAWYLLCMMLFTPTAAWLLNVMYGSLRHKTCRIKPYIPPSAVMSPTSVADLTHPKSQAIYSPDSPTSTSELSLPRRYKPVKWSIESSASTSYPQNDGVKQLRRALRTVALQFSATFICMGAAAGGCLWVSIDAVHITVSPTLHAFGIIWCLWIFSVAGCLVNMFVLIRTGRPKDDKQRLSNTPVMPGTKFSSFFASRGEAVSGFGQIQGSAFVMELDTIGASAGHTLTLAGRKEGMVIGAMHSLEYAEAGVLDVERSNAKC